MSKPTATSPGVPSQRQLRVGEQVRHALAEILSRGEVMDPDLEGRIITVPEVRMSPDLRLATAYVMPLGGTDRARILAALDRNRRMFKGELSRRLKAMKYMPDVRFRLDERFDEAAKIDRLLDDPRVKRDLPASDPHDGEDP